jgi:predicted nucleic acid-binding protein
MILLDTDIMVDILRAYPPAVSWLRSQEEQEIGLPGYVVIELLDGEPNKESMNKMQRVLEPYLIHWPNAADCNRALSVFAQGKLSHNLSAFDALIAETAKGIGVPLHTFNLKHFKAIPGLDTVQPYEKSLGLE